MANKHYRNWLYQMPLGLVFTAASIIVLMYSIKNRPDEQWLMWAVISAVGFIIGLSLFGNALIHKMKSDLIRKSKKRKTSSTLVDEEQVG